MSEVLAALQTAGYRFSLVGENIRLDFIGEGDPDPLTVQPLCDALLTHKAAAIAHLRQQEPAEKTLAGDAASALPPHAMVSDRYASLAAAMEHAPNEQILDAILETVETAYGAEEVSHAQAEELARIAMRCARSWSQKPTPSEDNVVQVWPDDFAATRACYACGQERWWTDILGNRKCGVCHPAAPGAHIESRRRGPDDDASSVHHKLLDARQL